RAGPTVRVGEVTIDPRAPINPERTYRLILWEENVVLSGAGTTYRTFLEDRVEAFREVHPNVTVEFQLLPPGEAVNRLHGALSSGRRHYCNGTLSPRLFGRKYQMPVAAFLLRARDREPAYLPTPWEALSADGKVWGWSPWIRFIT